jgi:hypothetical protein
MQERVQCEEVVTKLKANDPELKELSLGNLVSNEDDLEALTEALSVNNTVEKILIKDLTLTVWTESGAKALGNVLKNHPRLGTLSIGSMFSNQTPKHIISGLLLSLTGNAPVKSFSYSFDSNKFPGVIRTIGEYLHENSTLESIYLEGTATSRGSEKFNQSDVSRIPSFYIC